MAHVMVPPDVESPEFDQDPHKGPWYEGPTERPRTQYRPQTPPPRRPLFTNGQWRVLTWVAILLVALIAAGFAFNKVAGALPKLGKIVQPKETVITSKLVLGPIIKKGRVNVAIRDYQMYVDSNVKIGVVPTWLLGSNAHAYVRGRALFFVDLKGITFDAVQVSPDGQSVTIHVPQLPTAGPEDVFVTRSWGYDDGCAAVQSVFDHLVGDLYDCQGASEDQLREVGRTSFVSLASRDQRSIVRGEQQLRDLLADLLEKNARAAGVTVPFTLTVVFPGDLVVQAPPTSPAP